jgi:hypothetical protein
MAVNMRKLTTPYDNHPMLPEWRLIDNVPLSPYAKDWREAPLELRMSWVGRSLELRGRW